MIVIILSHFLSLALTEVVIIAAIFSQLFHLERITDSHAARGFKLTRRLVAVSR